MAERSKATVLKTVEQQCSVGSNPTPSATPLGGRRTEARSRDLPGIGEVREWLNRAAC